MLNQSYIYSRLKSLFVSRAQSRHIVFIPEILYTPRITMKLYDMIQVYSSGSTVIMNMHCIWPVLHMTSCLDAINKNRDMCFDMKNGKKKTYFSGEIPVNDCRNVWRGLKSISLIKKKIRISKVSCKESSRRESLRDCLVLFLILSSLLTHRRQGNSKTFSLFSSSFLVVQVSALCNNIERISDW